MTQSILDEVEKNHKKTNGKCGLPYLELIYILGISQTELRKSLNVLYKQKAIRIQQGINSKLLFMP